MLKFKLKNYITFAKVLIRFSPDFFIHKLDFLHAGYKTRQNNTDFKSLNSSTLFT